MTEIAPVEVSMRVPGTPPDVFGFFTDPARYVQWMGSEGEPGRQHLGHGDASRGGRRHPAHAASREPAQPAVAGRTRRGVEHVPAAARDPRGRR